MRNTVSQSERKPHYVLIVAALVFVCSMPSWAGPGAEMYNDLLEQGAVYDDQELQDYVTRVGERLLAVSPHKGRSYTFVVVDNPLVNASATEDAYIFIFRGILPYFASEDELAAVLGHEIGHVVGRHHGRQRTSTVLGTVLAWTGMFATGTSATHDLFQTLTTTVQAGYGRKFELESDGYGVEFLAKAGYDPRAMVNVIQALRDHDLYNKKIRNSPPVYHGIFGSHPAHAKRINDMIVQWDNKLPDALPEYEGDFLAHLDGLVFGDEAATGLIKDDTYYHGGLRLVIRFPAGWDINNSPAEVYSQAPKGGDASISVQRQDPPKEQQTPEEYIAKTLKRDDVKSGEALTVNGTYPAYIGEIEVAAGNVQKRLIGIVYKDDGVYLFKGEVGPHGDAVAFDKQFRDTVESLRAMTSDDLKVANSQVIHIIVAEPGDTYAKLAAQAPIKKYGEETLRVINGHHPHGEPRAGDYIKVVR